MKISEWTKDYRMVLRAGIQTDKVMFRNLQESGIIAGICLICAVVICTIAIIIAVIPRW